MRHFKMFFRNEVSITSLWFLIYLTQKFQLIFQELITPITHFSPLFLFCHVSKIMNNYLATTNFTLILYY